MSDEDGSLSEKRVFEERRGVSLAFVASAIGLARVEISDDQIGRFGLVHRGVVLDVAVDTHEGNTVAIATDETVRRGTNDSFTDLDFGSPAAVTFADVLVAADANGAVARYLEDRWSTIASLDGTVTAMDGDLVATTDGVYRIEGENLVPLGLDGVRDVAAAGPLAATDTGVYHFADGGWTSELDGNGTAVASSTDRRGGLDGHRTAAVVDGAVLERSDGEWHRTECPVETVVDIAVGKSIGHAIYAIAEDGSLFVDPPTAKDGATGWTSRSLGVTDVAGIAVIEPGE